MLTFALSLASGKNYSIQSDGPVVFSRAVTPRFYRISDSLLLNNPSYYFDKIFRRHIIYFICVNPLAPSFFPKSIAGSVCNILVRNSPCSSHAKIQVQKQLPGIMSRHLPQKLARPRLVIQLAAVRFYSVGNQ
jgi:hypothetical protein